VQSDAHLLAAIASGSSEAIGALYDAHARVVFGLAKRILGKPEDAEEIVQDVFAQVWRDARKYEQSRASVAGWLVMMTRTRAIDRLRARKARPDLDQPADPVPILQATLAKSLTPEALAVTGDEAARVGAALERLRGDERRFIDLAYFEGLSQSEIAEHTGTPLGTVKTRMRTALQTLRAALTS
jgi:RNA polymerase sigma-70 factor (ECF subfamily)